MQALRIRSVPVALVILIGTYLALCLAASVQAANPSVTLKLQNVTASEAVAALSKASGVSIEFAGWEPGERGSFDWSAVPLAQAMRDLRDGLHVSFIRPPYERAYKARVKLDLLPVSSPVGEWIRAVPGNPIFPISITRNGVRLSIRNVSVTDPAARQNGPPGQLSGGVSLALGMEWPGGDADRISRITHLIARDDLGNVLTEGGDRGPGAVPQFPDEWSGGISFVGYDPRARKLTSVEGVVEQYAVVREDVINLALPLAPEATHNESNNLKLEVKKLEILGGGARSAAEAVLRLSAPALALGDSWRRRGEPPVLVALLGASGRAYPVASMQGIGSGRPPFDTGEFECSWGPIPETITGLRISSQERGDSRPLTAFRFENVPLPPWPAPDPREAPPHALFDGGGGSLSGLVQVNPPEAQARLSGVVTFGLSRMTEDWMDPPAWIDAPLRRDGSTKLEWLKPGSYRVQRGFYAEGPLDLPQLGHWLNNEVRVEIRPGKETVQPPLVWTSNSAILHAK